jgi:hypothetical protein
VLGLAGGVQAADRVLEGSAEAKGLERLQLESHVGSIEVVATSGDRISWKVRLEPDHDDGWLSSRKDAQAAIDGAKVRAGAAGSTWQLELELPRGTDFDDVLEHWTIEVPTRFGLELESNVGEVAIKGLAGGVEAELNVGELTIEVPKGDLRARVNVGELRLTSRTASLGRVELEANVGSADLTVAGKRVESAGLFVGGRVSSEGDGEDDVDARVNVGEVRLRVER